MIPSDLAGESQVVRWCFAATNSLEIPLMTIAMIDWFKDEGSRKYKDFLVGWANRHLSNLERWLEQRQYIATDSFTVADILMVHVLAVIKDASLLKPFSNVRSYLDRCLARPAWQRTIEAYNKNVVAG